MKKILLRWFWSLIEYLMFVPVILIVAGLTLPINYALVFTYTLPLHVLIALTITAQTKKTKNIIFLISGIIYTFIVSCIWIITTSVTSEHILFYILGTALFFYWGIKRGTSSRDSLFFYTGGLVIHGLSLLIFNGSPLLNPLFNIALVMAVFYVIVALPIANRHFLITESLQKNSLNTMPSSVIRSNWIMLVSIFIVIAILSIGNILIKGLGYLYSALGYSIKYIMGVIRRVLDLFLEKDDQLPFIPEEGYALLEENPTADLIANLLIATIFAFVFYLIIKYFIRNGKKIVRRFIGFFTRLFNSFQVWGEIEKNYIDEQEFLIQTEKKLSLNKKGKKREKQWKEMKDNSSRARFIYKRFIINSIKKGYKFSKSHTPSEAIKKINTETNQMEENHERIAETYNDVRYGIKQISDDTVRMLKDEYL